MRNIKINTVIVDDKKEFCTVLSDCLSNQGDFVIKGICLNGIEAIKFVKEIRPNLIVLDVVMPRLDGLGVLEKLTALNLKPKPIMVVLSAIGLDRITQRALSLGADYYFIKPFDMDEFIVRVHQLVDRNGLESWGTWWSTGKSEMNLESQVTYIMHELGIPVNLYCMLLNFFIAIQLVHQLAAPLYSCKVISSLVDYSCPHLT